ncbi:MAG: hypothetical protein GC136_08600 [Alphaproteobacteria bacterium]|nr:hypothetical protein [Alphaproteobacteria bacterium]
MPHHEHLEAQATFLANKAGKVAIEFEDPAFVRSDAIIFDGADGTIHAIFSDQGHYLGKLSADLLENFLTNEEVVLYAAHPDGYVFDRIAPILRSTVKGK